MREEPTPHLALLPRLNHRIYVLNIHNGVRSSRKALCYESTPVNLSVPELALISLKAFNL